jgi:SAM-dependent methyltransferase
MELDIVGCMVYLERIYLIITIPITEQACKLCGKAELKVFLSFSKGAIAECSICGNACTLPPPNAIRYASESFTKRSLGLADTVKATELNNLPKNWKNSIKHQVLILTKWLPKGARILEVGCAEGILLKELQKAKFKCLGVEPSTVSSKIARERGIDVICDSFPSKQIQGFFGAVVFSHSLEHFSEPLAMLNEAIRLSPNGYIYLTQTNYKGIIPALYKQRWTGWAPESHYYHFTPRGIAFISKQLGLTPVVCSYNSIVHGNGLAAKFLEGLSKIIPKLSDQFNILLQSIKQD